jgi:GNAT superfamily N-acetyltransferase
MEPHLEIHPLTRERWSDFEKLFGKRGAYGGCWCMWWRVTRATFEKQQGEGNKKAMQEIVNSDEVPGIIAYSDGEPVGWCSVAPRESYASLNRSRVLKRLDEKPVWSIVCFFIAKEHRSKGLTTKLVEAAIEYVRRQGGLIVEAYPTLAKSERMPPTSSYMGLPQMFEQAGFVECSRPSKSKVVMRFTIK